MIHAGIVIAGIPIMCHRINTPTLAHFTFIQYIIVLHDMHHSCMHYLPCDTTQDSPIPGGCGNVPTTSSTLAGSANSSS